MTGERGEESSVERDPFHENAKRLLEQCNIDTPMKYWRFYQFLKERLEKDEVALLEEIRRSPFSVKGLGEARSRFLGRLLQIGVFEPDVAERIKKEEKHWRRYSNRPDEPESISTAQARYLAVVLPAFSEADLDLINPTYWDQFNYAAKTIGLLDDKVVMGDIHPHEQSPTGIQRTSYVIVERTEFWDVASKLGAVLMGELHKECLSNIYACVGSRYPVGITVDSEQRLNMMRPLNELFIWNNAEVLIDGNAPTDGYAWSMTISTARRLHAEMVRLLQQSERW